MKNKKLHLFTIMPLNTAHVEELCQDIRYQYENGIANFILFQMTLSPEGDPVVNKAKSLCEKYDIFKKRLSEMGIPCGVLVQATIGHGIDPNVIPPFQQYIPFLNVKERYIVCPYDENFQKYIYDALRTIAQHSPEHIMIDDDLRLICRHGSACTCPLHMKRFNELANANISREQLHDIITDHRQLSQEYSSILIETQKESVIQTAKAIRAGIDSVDPTIPGSFCCVGNNAEFADDIAEIVAGKGNPITIRINNSNYQSPGPKMFSKSFFRAAAQIEKLRDKADVILAETDTYPQNRYSTGAMALHTHFTGSILEGVKGAKHWITRLDAFEPESGMAYRNTLSKYSRFYEKLAEIVPTLKWRGCRIAVSKKPKFIIEEAWSQEKDSAWVTFFLERVGLPVFFSSQNDGVLCLEGDDHERLSDEEIYEALKGNVVLSSDAAEHLIQRGFGKFIGTDVREWSGKQPKAEQLFINGNPERCQPNTKELLPTSPKAIPHSMVYYAINDNDHDYLFPGTLEYENDIGGRVFTFCGTPRVPYSNIECFSFLNYSRKQQFIEMMKKTGELPIYYPNDEEVYLRAADMPNGELFCAIFNISTDPIDKPELVCDRNVSNIDILAPDGTRQEVSFKCENGRIVLETPCNILTPVILFIR